MYSNEVCAIPNIEEVRKVGYKSTVNLNALERGISSATRFRLVVFVVGSIVEAVVLRRLSSRASIPK